MSVYDSVIRAGSASNRYALQWTLGLCAVCAIALTMTGCHPAGRAIPPIAEPRSAPHTNFALVADFGQERQPAADEKKTTPQPAADGEKLEPAPVTDDAKKPQQPERRYTAPGVPIQQLTLLALGAATTRGTAVSELAGAGREATESSVVTGESVLGRPGLTAPQPTVAGAVVSRAGLQIGPANGLGFAGPSNILTPQFNRLSGPTGRCAILANAGFFGGNRTTCAQHFRR